MWGAPEDATPEMRIETNTLIRKQVDRLANMISELLEFTQGSQRSASLTPHRLWRFHRPDAHGHPPGGGGKECRDRMQNDVAGIFIAMEETRLLHVFYNLIHNAIDVMPKGGKIMLRFQVGEREVVTEIEDSGSGIAPEIAPRLFEPFATHGKTHGTGLGLSICRRIIEDHHGTIHVRSEPNRGAIFYFTLPRVAAV